VSRDGWAIDEVLDTVREGFRHLVGPIDDLEDPKDIEERLDVTGAVAKGRERLEPLLDRRARLMTAAYASDEMSTAEIARVVGLSDQGVRDDVSEVLGVKVLTGPEYEKAMIEHLPDLHVEDVREELSHVAAVILVAQALSAESRELRDRLAQRGRSRRVRGKRAAEISRLSGSGFRKGRAAAASGRRDEVRGPSPDDD
jgi:hypothetical protein